MMHVSSNLEGHSTSGQNAPQNMGLEPQLKMDTVKFVDAAVIQVGSNLKSSSSSLDAPGSSGLQFELNNLRNELRAKQREHSETEEEVCS
jgi:hypothetical protein